MRYLVDKKMVITDDGVTTPGLDNTEQVLSPLPYRLLCFFIANNDRLVTREEIFFQVWENHDLVPSGTALATQVSFLRKLFSNYGLGESVLTTVPKQGLLFKASIEILPDTRAYIPPKRVLSDYNNLKWVIAFLVIIPVTFLFYRLYYPLFTSEELVWKKIGVIKSCPIYVIDDDMSPVVRDYYLRKANSFITDHQISCQSNDKILEFIQHPGISAINDVYETKQFYAYCRWMKESYLCNNTYFSAGNTK